MAQGRVPPDGGPLIRCYWTGIQWPQDHAAWLDPSVADVQALQEMLAPFPGDLMQAYAVSRKVNNALNEGPDLIEPITTEQ